MTSTSFNVGINEGTRLSSRVLRPPGGGHTDIFGGEPEPPRAGGRRPAPSVLANMAQTQGQGDEPAKPTNGAEAPSQNGQASEPAPTPEAPAPTAPEVTPTAPASSPTEEKADVPKAKADAPKAVTPTESKPDAPKRVRVPPGGFSSGLW